MIKEYYESLSKLLKKHSRILGLVFAILISVVAFLNKDRFTNLKGYGYFGLFLISIIGNATIILPIPVILTAFIGGAIFNPFLVAIVVATGAAIGELTGYMAGYGSQELIENDPKYKNVRKWMEKYGLWTLFFLAAIPNPLFDLAGIVAGATGVPVYKYLIVVWAGKIVKFTLISYLGAGSVNLIDKYI